MSFEVAVFYLFSAVLVFSAIRVITARNSVHSALFLVLSFFTAAAIWPAANPLGPAATSLRNTASRVSCDSAPMMATASLDFIFLQI